MADLIDRAALIKEIWSIGNHPWSDWETVGVINLVNRQTAVDAVEVVRCRSCVNATPEWDKLWCEVQGNGTSPDNYCSDGVRRTNATD